MFGKTKAFSGVAVDDIEKARQFYGETLGIEVSEVAAGGLLVRRRATLKGIARAGLLAAPATASRS